jgi:ParB family chromosome partitioning protein
VDIVTNSRPISAGQGTTGSGEDPEAAAARAEAAKREWRKVITLNKLGNAAIAVRRDFMRELLTRKTPPKGAGVFVAGCLARDSYLLTQNQADDIAAELLGLDSAAAIGTLVDNLGSGGDGRAQVIVLALVLGALETRSPKDAWRSGNSGWFGHAAKPGELLKFLAANGYTLAPVEEIITGERDSEGVYSECCS